MQDFGVIGFQNCAMVAEMVVGALRFEWDGNDVGAPRYCGAYAPAVAGVVGLR